MKNESETKKIGVNDDYDEFPYAIAILEMITLSKYFQ